MPWALLQRDQEAVAQRIAAHDYDQVLGTGWGGLDEFLTLLAELGVLPLFDIPGEGYQRRLIPLALLLTTYSLKVLAGLSSMNQVPALLFREVGLLERIGFTARQIQQGFSRRGKGRMRPVHKNTIAEALDRLTPEEVAGLFNGSTQAQARAGCLGDTVFSLDGCYLHTTDRYPGAGSITMTATRQTKGGPRTTTVTRHGYLLCSLWGTQGRSVAAATLKPLGSGEVVELLPLVRQAQANLVGKRGRLRILLGDGAFCAGLELWQLKQELGVDFVVRATTTMQVCADARGLLDQRDRWVTRGERADVAAVGVARLSSYQQYAPPKGTPRPGPPATINAVVITKWAGEPVPRGEEVILLTSLPVRDPLRIVDLYQRRAWMENQLHRELKQGWHLERFPAKTDQACRAHVFLTLLLYSLAQVFKSRQGQALINRGIRRLRAERLRTSHIVLVIAAPYFGLFDIEEFATLLGAPPKHLWRFRPWPLLT